ncbi:hypothetical protein ATCC27039_14240 [Actinomyces naeslundii]|nr:hypothetical protein ATCC27039_14240 [Actinomyces naeslundii]
MLHGAGTYVVKPPKNDWWELEEVYQFKIGYLFPSVNIMSVPPSAPTQVKDNIIKSSRVLFADPGLAATALRSAVECFLTHQGIPSTQANGKPENLSERIKKWQNIDHVKNGVIGDLLTAVKWIGNIGTHDGGNLTTNEFLEGAEILDEAFRQAFTGSQIHATARSISDNKGPRRVP